MSRFKETALNILVLGGLSGGLVAWLGLAVFLWWLA
jgi:hypothetical protein